jgi:hypothetical protein
LQFLRRGKVVLNEVLKNRSRLARTADHSQKQKRLADPVFQNQRIVTMTTRDDESESGNAGKRQRTKLVPCAGLEGNFVGEKIVVCDSRRFDTLLAIPL